jgi:hypothetical protein
MNTTHTLNRIIAGALLSGGVAIAGIGLAAGAAQAQPGLAPLARWCPGQPLPSPQPPVNWDMNVCYDWHYAWLDNPHAGNQVVDGPVNCWAIFPRCLY